MYLPEGGRPRGSTDRALRHGLARMRTAQPPPEVWERIVADLPPPRSAGVGRWRMSLPVATVAGAAFLVVVALGVLNGEMAAVRGRDAAPVVAAILDHGLPQAELAIQPDLAPRPVDLTLPSGQHAWWRRSARLSGWHRPQLALNRARWPVPDPPLTEESVAPWFDARLR